MGYYVNIFESDVVLPAKALPEILKRWKDLNKPENDHLKHGGSYYNGIKVPSYSWMDADYDKNCDTILDLLEELRFEVEQDPETGDISIISFDRKMGQEDLFFNAISDLIPMGQSITWHGEDGSYWMWMFDGSKMLTKTARIVFD